MALHASCFKKTFHFGFDARTSRGLMKEKTSWFIRVWDEKVPGVFGVGECGPLPGLSMDDRPDYEGVLLQTIEKICLLEYSTLNKSALTEIVPAGFPSITFGVATALLDLLNGGKRIIFDNKFYKGDPIPINGLIWMGDLDFMKAQIQEKIAKGFKCIKLKVGGLDFDSECGVLAYIRGQYSQNITIRLDANGAFKVGNAMSRLKALAKFDIHSIEQPIQPNLPEMAELCHESPIPIALDEELIGKETRDSKVSLLNRVKPQFIILKPTLHGGFSGCSDWIEIAESLGVGWWITSALESNIGLNAICQFTAEYPVSISQGLGTGAIYENNIPSPLTVEDGNIFMDSQGLWGDLMTVNP